jgi:hypothetical protein
MFKTLAKYELVSNSKICGTNLFHGRAKRRSFFVCSSSGTQKGKIRETVAYSHGTAMLVLKRRLFPEGFLTRSYERFVQYLAPTEDLWDWNSSPKPFLYRFKDYFYDSNGLEWIKFEG